MTVFSRATTRGDWTGEWDTNAVTQALLRLDSFTGDTSVRATPDTSGRGREANAVNFITSSPISTRWGAGIRLNQNPTSSYVRVMNDGSLFPSSGSMMVGCWVNFNTLGVWSPVFSTRETSGKAPLVHCAITPAGRWVPQFRLYNSSGTQILSLEVGSALSTGEWYWIGAVLDLTLGTYSFHVVPLTGTPVSSSGTIAGMNTSCEAHLDLGFGGGVYSNGTFDEAVLVAPFTGNAQQLALRSRVADGAVAAVQADTTTVVGRVAPVSGASLPVVVQTRAMPAAWGAETPQITINGYDTTVRYRTSNNLTSWGSWKNASLIETEASAAWIQYEVSLNSASAYCDEILLSTAPPPTPPLPNTREVQPFSLDPLLAVPGSGGVFIQDTLLECKTLDTTSNESTLTFTLSLADPRASLIEPEMPVTFKGRHYVARGITTTKTGTSGRVEVYCERIWYNLVYAGQIDAQTWSSTARDAMTSVLAGTDWYVGQIDKTNVLNWENESGTVLGVLNQIASLYGGDLVFDDQTHFVHLLNQGGRDRGTYFTYEKGVESATRRTDTTSLVTRIYGRNAEGLTIAPANGGVDYVEDFTWTNEVRVSVYDFRSGMTPQAMMNFLVPFLALRATPNLSYEYQVSGLIDRVDEVDRFEVRDIIFVMDEDFEQSVKSRIVSLEIDWVDLRNSKITLSNSLRTLASSDASTDPGRLSTGQTIDTRDINPFNLLLNSRGDNGMAHWAGSQVQVVEGGATGRYAFAFGAGGGYLEQTVASDNRDNFVLSAAVDAPSDANLLVEVTIQYADGTSETQVLEL